MTHLQIAAIAAAAVLLLTAGILHPMRACFDLRIRASVAEVRVVLRLFYCMIPISLRIRLQYVYERGILIYIIRKRGALTLHGKVGQKRKQSNNLATRIFSGNTKLICVEALCVDGEIGIKSDPAKSVIAAGSLNALLRAATPLLLPLDSKAKHKIYISPCLTRNAFALNMEGILRLNTGKFIVRLVKTGVGSQSLKKQAIKQRRDNDESPNRKHNAIVNG